MVHFIRHPELEGNKWRGISTLPTMLHHWYINLQTECKSDSDLKDIINSIKKTKNHSDKKHYQKIHLMIWDIMHHSVQKMSELLTATNTEKYSKGIYSTHLYDVHYKDFLNLCVQSTIDKFCKDSDQTIPKSNRNNKEYTIFQHEEYTLMLKLVQHFRGWIYFSWIPLC